MPVLTLENVRKSYGVKPLLDDVSLIIEAGEKAGVIGPNGAGKTTLLRIAAGVEPPDGGRVIRHGTARVGWLPQRPVLDPGHSALRAVLAGPGDARDLLRAYDRAAHALERSPEDAAALAQVSELSHRLDATGGWQLEADARAQLGQLGIADADAPVANMSGGQQKRVALARALVEAPDLLILDEPTNHLDAEATAWLEGVLARFPGALLLVTHDRYFLDRVTGRMLEVSKGQVQTFVGNYAAYLEQKAEQATIQAAEEARRQNLARRELEWLRRGPKARTSKAKYRVDRAHELINAPKAEAEETLSLSAAASRLGKKVIVLDGVSKAWGETPVLTDFTYRFERQDRIGIIGPNGAGKTTLLELVAGRIRPDAGTIETGPTVSVGYYDQESRALEDDVRLLDYIEAVAENVKTADGTVITASQMLERFLFPPAQQRTPIGLLSGGERRRLYLLRVLMGAPNVLLLDEPTNDLDIPTLVALEEYLETFPGCLITVSHDRYFLDRTVHHLFRFEGDGRVRTIAGNYSAWLELKAAEDEQARETRVPPKTPAPAKPPASEKPASERKLSYKERKELEETEARIGRSEARQAEIADELTAAGDDYERVAALSEELQRLVDRMEADVERWAELAERA